MADDSNRTIESIRNKIVEWTERNIGSDFSFRQGQLEGILYIINNILNRDVETTIIQAPTGSGKSLILIIAAGVLSTYYNLKSYILASDLYLWQQYAAAINKYKLRNFGYLKGSMGNYTCHRTNTDYQTGKCRIEKVSLTNMRNRDWRMKNGWSCAETCLYMKQRFRAEMASVSLLTYQLWLYQMNLVEHEDKTMGFQPRPVIFCDECHNIPDIVEKYAQPVINVVEDREKFCQIVDYAIANNIEVSYCADCMRPDALRKLLMNDDETTAVKAMNIDEVITLDTVISNYDYFVDCLGITEDIDHRHDIKMDILLDFMPTVKFVEKLAESALDKMSGMEEPSSKKEQKKRLADFKALSWMHNYASMLTEFMKSASSAGHEYVVIEESKDRITGMISYTLSCVKEDYLCYNFLMKNAKYKVMTSATVGNKEFFRDNIGVKYCESGSHEFMDMPSIFDYSKSPIYFLPKYKMSYQNKQYDFPKIMQTIYQILGSVRFKDKHGMINTGSYDNMKQIYDNAPNDIKKRLCMYLTSKDKKDTIERFTAQKDAVLIGPTLVEGVDLPDDLCRFIIIAKIPYPNISSKTVKAKMNIFPMWYDSTTSNTVIQNIGRGVRNEHDYCETFILDGCFQRLYENTQNQYPIEIQQRIKIL